MFTLKKKMLPSKSEETGENLLGLGAAQPTRVTKSVLIARIEKRCTLTSADVKAALDAVEYQVGQALLNGRSVRFGDFGSFRGVVKNAKKMVTNPAELSADDVKCVFVRFTPSTRLRSNLKPGNGVQFAIID